MVNRGEEKAWMYVCLHVCMYKDSEEGFSEFTRPRLGKIRPIWRSFIFYEEGGTGGIWEGGGGEVMRKTLKWHDLSSFKKIAIEQTSKTGYKFIYV